MKNKILIILGTALLATLGTVLAEQEYVDSLKLVLPPSGGTQSVTINATYNSKSMWYEVTVRDISVRSDIQKIQETNNGETKTATQNAFTELSNDIATTECTLVRNFEQGNGNVDPGWYIEGQITCGCHPTIPNWHYARLRVGSLPQGKYQVTSTTDAGGRQTAGCALRANCQEIWVREVVSRLNDWRNGRACEIPQSTIDNIASELNIPGCFNLQGNNLAKDARRFLGYIVDDALDHKNDADIVDEIIRYSGEENLQTKC